MSSAPLLLSSKMKGKAQIHLCNQSSHWMNGNSQALQRWRAGQSLRPSNKGTGSRWALAAPAGAAAAPAPAAAAARRSRVAPAAPPGEMVAWPRQHGRHARLHRHAPVRQLVRHQCPACRACSVAFIPTIAPLPMQQVQRKDMQWSTQGSTWLAFRWAVLVRSSPTERLQCDSTVTPRQHRTCCCRGRHGRTP